MALGAFATLTAAELVRTDVELVSRDLEMAQLRQALISRISIEQAKGVLAASQEVTPNERFQQLRAWARSSSRRLADLVRKVMVQEAQCEWVAALAMDDARGRVAEARAQATEQAVQAGPEPGWPNVLRSWTEPKMTPKPGSGPPTDASESRARTIGRGWCW